MKAQVYNNEKVEAITAIFQYLDRLWQHYDKAEVFYTNIWHIINDMGIGEDNQSHLSHVRNLQKLKAYHSKNEYYDELSRMISWLYWLNDDNAGAYGHYVARHFVRHDEPFDWDPMSEDEYNELVTELGYLGLIPEWTEEQQTRVREIEYMLLV